MGESAVACVAYTAKSTADVRRSIAGSSRNAKAGDPPPDPRSQRRAGTRVITPWIWVM